VLDYRTSDYAAVAIFAQVFGGEYQDDGSLILKNQSFSNINEIKEKFESCRKQLLWSNMVGYPSINSDENNTFEDGKTTDKQFIAIKLLMEGKSLKAKDNGKIISFSIIWKFNENFTNNFKTSGFKIDVESDNNFLP
jgi:hypothetical protein